jgi:hypothetical protein
MFVFYSVCVVCDGPIPSPEESYRLWCVLECDQMKLQKPSTPNVNKYVEEGRTKKEITDKKLHDSELQVSKDLVYNNSTY